MYKSLATATIVGALFWPAAALASLDYTNRAPSIVSAKRIQPAAPATIAPTYYGYYGPINGPTSRPAPIFLGLGGKW